MLYRGSQKLCMERNWWKKRHPLVHGTKSEYLLSLILKSKWWGAWLASLLEYVTLDLRVFSLSPMSVLELT